MVLTKPSELLVAAIMFTLVIGGGLFMIASFQSVDDSFIVDTRYDTLNTTFYKFAEVNSTTSSLQSGVENAEPDQGVLGVLNSLINTAWNTLKGLFDSFSFLTDIIKGISDMFDVPTWVTTLIASLITVVIVFGIFSAIFQREL